MIAATARAIVRAVAAADASGTDSCRVNFDLCAATSDFCVADVGQCGGADFTEVLPCCDPDYRCFVLTEDAFFCRHRLFQPPSFWDGRIEECTLGFGDDVRAPSPV